MGSKLVGTIHRDQRADRDEAAVALRKTGTLPDIAEQDIVGEVRELRRDIAHQLLRASLIGSRGVRLRRRALGDGRLYCFRCYEHTRTCQSRPNNFLHDSLLWLICTRPQMVREKKGFNFPIAASTYLGTQ